MAKITIRDIPKNKELSKEEMKAVYGGIQLASGYRGLYIFPTFGHTGASMKTAAPDEEGATKINISF